MFCNNPLFRFDKSTDELFLDLLKKANKELYTLTLNDIDIDNPVAKGRTLTDIQVAASSSSTMKGKVSLSYSRLDLTEFFFGIPIYIETDNVEITKEYISEQIYATWQVLIEPSEFDLAVGVFGSDLPTQFTVTAKETSVLWVGSIEGWILPENHIGKLFVTNPLSYNLKAGKINAFIYSIEKDITTASEELIELLEESFHLYTMDADTVKVTSFLSELTGDEWLIKQRKANFNLMDSVVLYKCPYSDEEPTRGVIVIRLSSACQNLTGNLIINYTIQNEAV